MDEQFEVGPVPVTNGNLLPNRELSHRAALQLAARHRVVRAHLRVLKDFEIIFSDWKKKFQKVKPRVVWLTCSFAHCLVVLL